MAIAYDAISAVDAKVSASATETWTHVCSGIGGVLWVVVDYTSGTGVFTTSVSYNSVALTRLHREIRGSMKHELWYLLAPDTGSHTVSVVTNDAGNMWLGYSVSYNGLNLSAPFGTDVSAQGTTQLATVTAASAYGEVVFAAVHSDWGTLAANTGQHERIHDVSLGNGGIKVGASDQVGSGTVTPKWTFDGSNDFWLITAVPMKPLSSATPQWWLCYLDESDVSSVRYACITQGVAQLGNSGDGNSGIQSLPIPTSGNILTFKINLTTAPGLGKSWHIQVLINGVASTNLDITITGAATTGIVTVAEPLAVGDIVQIRITPSGTPANTHFHISSEFMPDTDNYYCYGGIYADALGFGSVIPGYQPLFWSTGAELPSETLFAQTIAPCAGTIRAFYVRLRVAPGDPPGTNSWDFGIRINGATAGSLLNITGSTLVDGQTGLSHAVVAGDRLSFFVAARNGSPANGHATWMVIFEPTIAGNFVWGACSGGSNDTLTSAFFQRFIAPTGDVPGANQQSNVEANVQYTCPTDLVLSNYYFRQANAPGASKSWTGRTRIAGTDGTIVAAVTGAGTPVIGSDTTHSDVVNADQLINLSMTPTGSPAAMGAHTWSIVVNRSLFGDSQWWLSQGSMFVGGTRYQEIQSGYNRNAGGTNSTQSDVQAPIGISGYIKTLRIDTDVAPGGGNSLAVTLMVNGVASTTFDGIISGASTSLTVTGIQAVQPGDLLNIRIVSGGSPPTIVVKSAIEFNPSTANYYNYSSLWWRGQVSAANTHAPLWSAVQDSSVVTGDAIDRRNIAPFAGTIRSLYVKVNTAPGVGNSWDFSIVINGSDVGSLLNIAGTSKTSIQTGLAIAIALGDIVAIRTVNKNGSPGDTYVEHAVIIEPDVPGDFVSGCWSSSSFGGNTYWPYTPGPTLQSATESLVKIVCPDTLQVHGFAAQVSGAPPGGVSISFTNRINSVDSEIIATLASGNTVCSDYGASDDMIAGDLIDVWGLKNGVSAFSSVGGSEWSVCFGRVQSVVNVSRTRVAGFLG